MFRRLFAVLGYEPRARRKSEGVRAVEAHAAVLNAQARRFRDVAGEVVLLEARQAKVSHDLERWEARLATVRATEGVDPEVVAEASRIAGRLDGQVVEIRERLDRALSEERHLRGLLTSGREVFAANVEALREMGHDTSGCLLFVDLTRPEYPPYDPLASDDDSVFLERVVDAAAGRVH